MESLSDRFIKGLTYAIDTEVLDHIRSCYKSIKNICIKTKIKKTKFLFFNIKKEVKFLHIYINKEEYILELLLGENKVEDQMKKLKKTLERNPYYCDEIIYTYVSSDFNA